MNRTLMFAVAALSSTAFVPAQGSIDAGFLEQAAKVLREAKVPLADAVALANKACPGDVIRAALQLRSVNHGDRPRWAVWRVVILRDGKTQEVEVDGTTGEVEVQKPDSGVENVKYSFEDPPLGALPQGWTVAETAGKGKPAHWGIEESAQAPDGKRILRLAKTENSGATYNMVLTGGNHPADVLVRVKLRADAGEEDQGGGLAWRAKDADNYYIARWNPMERNLRAYKVEGGTRSKAFQSAEIEADPKAWHTLQVSMRGTQAVVSFDGKLVFEFEDDAFKEPGRIGLWTKADAATSFDLLEIEPLKAN